MSIRQMPTLSPRQRASGRYSSAIAKSSQTLRGRGDSLAAMLRSRPPRNAHAARRPGLRRARGRPVGTAERDRDLRVPHARPRRGQRRVRGAAQPLGRTCRDLRLAASGLRPGHSGQRLQPRDGGERCLPAGGRLLPVRERRRRGYSGTVEPDQTYGIGITDFAASNFAGIRIVDPSDAVRDGVGSPQSPCREGTGFSTPDPTATTPSSASAEPPTRTTTPPTSRDRSPATPRTAAATPRRCPRSPACASTTSRGASTCRLTAARSRWRCRAWSRRGASTASTSRTPSPTLTTGPPRASSSSPVAPRPQPRPWARRSRERPRDGVPRGLHPHVHPARLPRRELRGLRLREPLDHRDRPGHRRSGRHGRDHAHRRRRGRPRASHDRDRQRHAGSAGG